MMYPIVGAEYRAGLRTTARGAARLFAAVLGWVLMGATTLQAQTPKVVGAPPTLRGFSASPSVSMRVYVPSGRVRIVVWNRDSVDIRGTTGSMSSMFGGGNRDFVKMGVEPIRTGDTKMAEADWLVTVPRKAHVWVKMTTGAIETEGTAGELELYAVGGSISVERASGVTSVESIDATVKIESTTGDLRVRGSKAPMTFHDVTGSASIATVSGKVTITGTAPECRVETIGGDIAFSVASLRGVTVELQTHSGAIGISVGEKHLPILEFTSRTGAVKQPTAKGSLKAGRIIARSFKGAISYGFIKM